MLIQVTTAFQFHNKNNKRHVIADRRWMQLGVTGGGGNWRWGQLVTFWLWSSLAVSSYSSNSTISLRLSRSRSMLSRSWHSMYMIAVALRASRGSERASFRLVKIFCKDPCARRYILSEYRENYCKCGEIVLYCP